MRKITKNKLEKIQKQLKLKNQSDTIDILIKLYTKFKLKEEAKILK